MKEHNRNLMIYSAQRGETEKAEIIGSRRAKGKQKKGKEKDQWYRKAFTSNAISK